MKVGVPVGIVAWMLVPGAAHAWSNAGHRIVCQIAWERLTSEGRSLVTSTLALNSSVLDPNEECADCESSLSSNPSSFQVGCFWPDMARTDTFKGTYEYDFVNVPKAQTEFSMNRDCGAMDCAVVAIQRYAQYLSWPAEGGRPRERKALALRFLGHFVADLHQPLHVGFIEDLGGNNVKIRMTPGAQVISLHSAWDGAILARGQIDAQSDGTNLNGEITPTEAGSWADFDVAGWAAASYQLARTKAYSRPNGEAVLTGQTLGSEYLDAAFPVAKEQLKKAGVRLAHLINSIADGTLPANMIKFE